MCGTDPVILELGEAGVATVTLNRPDQMNAFSTTMRDGLWEALAAVRTDPGTHALVIEARGADFSAGADLTEFGTAGTQLEARRTRLARPIWERLWALPQPVVCAVQGNVIGTGLEIALLCDARIASVDAKLALPEARLGMLPGAGGTQSLTRLVGLSRALDMVLGSRPSDSATALASGLVDEIVSDPQRRAHELAAAWATLGAVSCFAAKRLIRSAVDSGDCAARIVERQMARLVVDTVRT